MIFSTFTRLITLGCYYSFAKQGGADGTVIRTGVYTIPNSLFIMTGVRVRSAFAGGALAKIGLGTTLLGNIFGTYGILTGETLMTPQATSLNSQEIIITIFDDTITAGEADFTFMFLQSVR